MVTVCVGRVDELPPGRMAEVGVGGKIFLLCNVQGEFYAIDGTCPHRGAPLAHGALHEHTVVCPWHAWEFDCRTGEGTCGNVQIAKVSVESELIYLHA